MQGRGRGGGPAPIGVAFDADVGNRIDAVLALAMLGGLVAKGEARRISLSVSVPSLATAQLTDVLNAYYAGGPPGATTIGVPAPGSADQPVPPLASSMLSTKREDGAPVYSSAIRRLVDTAQSSVLIRNILLAQNDKTAAVVLAGPATGLAHLVGLYGATPQLTAKVKHLVVALGAFGGGLADPSVKADIAASQKLFKAWPTPVVAVGTEVGEALPFPARGIDAMVAAAPNHPVGDAYRTFRAGPYDAPASGLAAVLHAVKPDDGFFKLSEPGTISVRDDGRTEFTPSSGGRHRYLIVDPAQRDRVLGLFVDLVSAPPPAAAGGGRGGRGGRGVVPPGNQQPPRPLAPPDPDENRP